MPQGSVLYDIGANIGIYTVYAAALGHQVVAIEKEPAYCKSLRSTLELSGFADSVDVIQGHVPSLDNLPGFPRPTHIKIDTDGDDLTYVKNAPETMAKVHSVIVETSLRKKEKRDEITKLLTEAGLTMVGRHNCAFVPMSSTGMDHWQR